MQDLSSDGINLEKLVDLSLKSSPINENVYFLTEFQIFDIFIKVL